MVTRAKGTKSPNLRHLQNTPSQISKNFLSQVSLRGPPTYHGFEPQPSRLPLLATLESPLAASWRYTILNVYHRLHLIVVGRNLITLIMILARKGSMLAFIDAAAMNLLISGLARHPTVINAMFICICALPRSAPFETTPHSSKSLSLRGCAQRMRCRCCNVVSWIHWEGITRLRKP